MDTGKGQRESEKRVNGSGRGGGDVEGGGSGGGRVEGYRSG